MLSNTELLFPNVSFRYSTTGYLKKLKKNINDRKSVFQQSLMSDIELEKLCQLPPKAWDSIPNLYNWQLVTCVCQYFGSKNSLKDNANFILWFVKERVSKDPKIASELISSLFKYWPEDGDHIEQLFQDIAVYMPQELSLPGSDWYGAIIKSVLSGHRTVHSAIDYASGLSSISSSLEKNLWKRLLKSIHDVNELDQEQRYYGISAIQELGFIDGLPRWPELNYECIVWLVPVVNFNEAFCSELVQFVVQVFTELPEEQQKSLPEHLPQKLKCWAIHLKIAEMEDFDQKTSRYDTLTIKNLTFAAENQSIRACRLLGLYYSEPEYQSSNLPLAREYLQKAAIGGDAIAQVTLRELSQRVDAGTLWEEREAHSVKQGLKGFLTIIKEFTQDRHGDATFRQAALHGSGDNMPLNRSEAFKLYKSLKDSSHIEGLHHLALYYRLGIETPVSMETAISLYKKCIDLGDTRAAYVLGCMYADGVEISKTSVLARQYLCRAAITGSSSAQKKLRSLMK